MRSQGGSTLPGPREVSLRLSSGPSRPQPNSDRGVTDMVTYLGQFFDHEFDLTKGESGEEAPIPIPKCDPKYDPECTGNAVMPFTRSDYNRTGPFGAPRQQINSVTAFLDGSIIYGSSLQRENSLRAFYKVGK